MQENSIIQGDALNILKRINEKSVDLVYLDPPFFTQDKHSLLSKANVEYSFDDKWNDIDDYLHFMQERRLECKRILKNTGSIFLHCDRNASHYLKVLMDKMFGMANFQSEIIWSYKRWSNSKKGLLNNHQVILFYSKTKNFKFNKIYKEYSETTNVDQILQERVRNENGKSIYKLDNNGKAVVGQSKKGVPLSDVWEIPFLNPKAKERVGYPTQKQIILLEQIIKLVTDEGDLVVDPFVGSGTTVVAAKMLNRKYIGIDKSKDAVVLTNDRLGSLIKTESHLLKNGKAAYRNLSEKQMNILQCLNATPVQRNSGIDGFLKDYIYDRPVSVKIQREDETLDEAVSKLLKSSKAKQCSFMILVRTHIDYLNIFDFDTVPDNMRIIDSYEVEMDLLIESFKNKSEYRKIEA
ncbi:MAG: site-specific DNA-methyltransferase [Clostridium sp.]|nr:site-specific DNA-methyltransferase [Clostridium sp.]